MVGAEAPRKMSPCHGPGAEGAPTAGSKRFSSLGAAAGMRGWKGASGAMGGMGVSGAGLWADGVRTAGGRTEVGP